MDATVVESNIHDPKDSWLLWDCVRVLTRLMKQAIDLGVSDFEFANRTKRAKRRLNEIHRAKNNQQRRPLYRDLLNVTDEVAQMAKSAVKPIQDHPAADIMSELLTETTGRSVCEWKGAARYWTLSRDPDIPIGWDYPRPRARFRLLKNHIAFNPGRIACYVDGERVEPQQRLRTLCETSGLPRWLPPASS